jgi:hypothetical protein
MDRTPPSVGTLTQLNWSIFAYLPDSHKMRMIREGNWITVTSCEEGVSSNGTTYYKLKFMAGDYRTETYSCEYTDKKETVLKLLHR